MAKTAIITGAAKNIGKGIAKGLLNDGYECILLDIDKAALQQTVHELDTSNDACFEYVIDIASIQAIDKFVEWLKQRGSRVEVLVNNAAFESEETVLTLSANALRRSNVVNLEGPFYLTSVLANEMIESKTQSNIIFITSTHSSVTRMHPLYSSTKAGVEMFIKEAALELADKGIRVNAVAPGPVEDTADLRANPYVPVGVSQQPQDVAECVNFLISEKARFITGQTIVVDGGFSIAHTHYWKNQNRL